MWTNNIANSWWILKMINIRIILQTSSFSCPSPLPLPLPLPHALWVLLLEMLCWFKTWLSSTSSVVSAMEDIYFYFLLELDNIPPLVVAATSSRRKKKSISSIKDTTILVDDDQISKRHNTLSISTWRGWSRGRVRARGWERRGRSHFNAIVDRFQDSSRFSHVVDLNYGDTHPGHSFLLEKST